MVVIQPGLLFDTEKQAQVLQYGIKSICYELGAPKDEVREPGGAVGASVSSIRGSFACGPRT